MTPSAICPIIFPVFTFVYPLTSTKTNSAMKRIMYRRFYIQAFELTSCGNTLIVWHKPSLGNLDRLQPMWETIVQDRTRVIPRLKSGFHKPRLYGLSII